MWTVVAKSTNPDDVTAFLTTYPQSRFAPAARLKLQQLQHIASQQRVEEQKRPAAQERQRREREAAQAQQRAEVQRREAERHRQDEAKRREKHAQQGNQGASPAPPPQVARLEPTGQQQAGAVVTVPTATLQGQGPSGGAMGGVQDWSREVQAFRIDLRPVSNREFLAFVTSQPQWEKRRISSDLHDGDYLKHWTTNGTVKPEEIDQPVRYVSYFGAEAYCKVHGKKVQD
jgi:formylglycine-generating enzyme required for sulfatase activity